VSQQPQKPQTNQQQLASPYRGTEQAPVIVKSIPAEKTPDEIKTEKNKAELDSKTVALTSKLVEYTWLLFLATGFLGVVTLALAVAALLQIFAGGRAIIAAVESAKAATTHAGHMERMVDLTKSIKAGLTLRRVESVSVGFV
jgi:hypothetical protein